MTNSESTPLVSIVVPVFNGERYLRESLDSIVNQTYPNVEILVMDDASTDSTPEIIASYGDRVKSFRQSQNRGQFGNINDGISHVTGKYTAIYHADDVYNPKIVERKVEFLETHAHVGAVFCLDIFINAEGREYGRLTIPAEFQTRSLFDFGTVLNGILKHKNTFLPGCTMVRTEIYRELGGFRGEEFQIASDLEMWLRIARRYDLGFLHEYLFSYRHGHENSTQVYYRLRTENERQFLILDEYLAAGGDQLATTGAIKAYKAHRAEDNLIVAVNHYILKDKKGAHTFLDKVYVKSLIESRQIRRVRLLILFFLLQFFLRIPHISFLADLFYRRFHVKSYPA